MFHFFIFIALFGQVMAFEEIDWVKHPEKVDVSCGQTVQLEWKYKSPDKFKTGDVIVLSLQRDNIRENSEIAQLTRFTYNSAMPQTTLQYTLPEPLPQAWIDTDLLDLDDGAGSTSTVFVLYKEDDREVGTALKPVAFEVTKLEDNFSFVCCPKGKLDGCLCRDDNTCDSGLICVEFGLSVKRCVEQRSDGKEFGKCKTTSPQCEEPLTCVNEFNQQFCEDPTKREPCPAPSAEPGRQGCLCATTSTKDCESGWICDKYGLCNDPNPLIGATCDAASTKSNPDQCAKLSTSAVSCQGGECHSCKPGTAKCLCDRNQCLDGLICQVGTGTQTSRCWPSIGCENCECFKGSCDAGLQCANNVCVRTGECTPGRFDCTCIGTLSNMCTDAGATCINNKCLATINNNTQKLFVAINFVFVGVLAILL